MSLISSDVFRIIQDDLADLEGKIIFVKGRYCGGKSKCSGLFYMDSKDNPIIKVAKGNLEEEEWFGILLHEYCHFIQWKNNTRVWNKFCDYDVTYSHIILKPEKYKKELISLMELEIDCERRTAHIIKENKLFDEEIYIRNANAILYKYAFLYKYSEWPDDNRKYRKVQHACPNNILKSYKDYLNIPKEIEDYYR